MRYRLSLYFALSGLLFLWPGSAAHAQAPARPPSAPSYRDGVIGLELTPLASARAIESRRAAARAAHPADS